MEKILRQIKKIIPKRLFNFASPFYHFLLSLIGATIYSFPARKIKVLGVTGTKGKSTTAELASAILEEAGEKIALLSTVRFKIGKESEKNLFRMTMPGRFFVQKFLWEAVNQKCTWAIIEMTSEGARQFRHLFLQMDALIFTNIAREHIESHGSFEKYKKAKLKIVKALTRSSKEKRLLIVNEDDPSVEFLVNTKKVENVKFSLKDAFPFNSEGAGLSLTIDGLKINSSLLGKFNAYNILSAIHFAKSFGISMSIIKNAIEKFKGVPGRMEEILAGQNFRIFVDYAHTPDSLLAVYNTFPTQNKICVFGSTGGGRDKWKRKEMGKIADEYCSQIILTNDDPYDERPGDITRDIAEGMSKHLPETIIDRREAIKTALKYARQDDVVLITGKGADPSICVENGKQIPWSDVEVAKEEINKLEGRNQKVEV